MEYEQLKMKARKSSSIRQHIVAAWPLVMLLGGVGVYYYFQDLAITPVRVVGLIAVTLLASLVAAQSDTGAAFFRFLKEADIERRKVVWPTHQETVQTALMVIIVTILISLFLAALTGCWAHRFAPGRGLMHG